MTDQVGLFDTIYSCRAMRRLHPDPVPEKQLLRLVDAANQAREPVRLRRAVSPSPETTTIRSNGSPN